MRVHVTNLVKSWLRVRTHVEEELDEARLRAAVRQLFYVDVLLLEERFAEGPTAKKKKKKRKKQCPTPRRYHWARLWVTTARPTGKVVRPARLSLRRCFGLT